MSVPNYDLDSTGYYPGHGWRPLRLRDPRISGWDVFDMQAKFNYVHNSTALALDGVFGPVTKANVETFQAKNGLFVDGIAGAMTQTKLALKVCNRAPLPNRVKGQMQYESSFLCGIYTPQYPNQSYDTGPLQCNTAYHPYLIGNFDVAVVIPILVQRVTEYHDKYVRQGVAEKRAWDAGQGSWNSPVLADRYAHGESVPQIFLDYIAHVTLYA